MGHAEWIDDLHLEVLGTRFVATATPLGPLDDCFVIVKTPELVRRYLELIEVERPDTIVELGIKEGGSTALMALTAEPDVLLAIDLESEMPPLLANLVAGRGLEKRLVTAFGLDQGDRDGLAHFVDLHRPTGGFDLVIDDASHVLGPTRTSFEVLFPRLRPGGLYVIEDWNSEYINAGHLARMIPDTTDFTERLAATNQVFHILNAPDVELPEEVQRSMLQVPTSDVGPDGLPSTLFERLVEAAGRADTSGLDRSAMPRSRPLVDLGVELMMISASQPDVIVDLRIDTEWISARRGPAALSLDDYRLEDSWTDFFGYLA